MMKKLFTLILVALVSVSAFSVNITGGTKLYLKPNSNWQANGARFAAYYYDGFNNNAWVSMTFVENHGGYPVYEAISPAGKNFTNVIFCRMNPDDPSNVWGNGNNMWNQTADLTYDGTNNCFQVASGTWNKGGGTWSVYTPPVVLTPSVVLTVPASVFIDETISLNALSENVDNPVITYSVKVPGSESFVAATPPYQPTVTGTYTFKAEVSESGNPTVLASDTKDVVVHAASSVVVRLKGIPASWNANDVHVYYWSEGTSGDFIKMDKKEGYYESTFNNKINLGFLFVNGSDWSTEANQSANAGSNVTENTCYKVNEDTDGEGKRTVEAIDCSGIVTGTAPNNLDNFTLSVSNKTITANFAGISNVELYSMTGQLLQKLTANKQFSQTLNTGIYVLRIDGESHKVVVR